MKQYILDEKDVKLYKRYSPVGFFFILIALVLVAIPVIWLFIPVSTFAVETSEGIKDASVTGMTLLPAFIFGSTPISELIAQFNVFGDFGFILPVSYFIATLFMGLTALCSAILALRLLIFLLFGQCRNPKAILTNAWFSGVFAFLFSALMIGMNYLKDLVFMLSKVETIPAVNFGTDLLVYILGGASLVAPIILSIYYAIAFRKGYYKNLVSIIETTPKEAEGITSPIFETPGKTINKDCASVGGHAYSNNLDLEFADIPDHITEIGPSAFSNCGNLKVVIIPKGITQIGYNAFFNCTSLKSITYRGTKEEWSRIKRGSNWLSKAGTDVVKCLDGMIRVDTAK